MPAPQLRLCRSGPHTWTFGSGSTGCRASPRVQVRHVQADRQLALQAARRSCGPVRGRCLQRDGQGQAARGHGCDQGQREQVGTVAGCR